jgi:hypothetical protein
MLMKPAAGNPGGFLEEVSVLCIQKRIMSREHLN